MIGTTLHVHILHLCKKDKLNFILLATYLHLVDEVRIHNLQTNHYYTYRRAHVRITQAHWKTVEFVLPYINRGPWVECGGKRERAIRITFNDFLRPAIEVWRAGLPYAKLICSIPKYEIDLISTYTNLPHVHLGMSAFVKGYSNESDIAVDVENNDYEFKEDDEILMFFGYPDLPPM